MAAGAVVYRDASDGDAQALADLGRDTFLATFGQLYPQADKDAFIAEQYALAAVAKRLSDAQIDVRLALREHAPIGFCTLGPLKLPFEPGGRRAREVYHLYLVEAAKGAGVADRLMDWAVDRARAWGAQDLYLGVYHANARALAFYARRGFTIVGRYDFPVGQTIDDERIMRLPLD